MVGERLSHFRVLEKIDAWGAGEEYRARDEQLERDIALRILPVTAFPDAAARAELLRNARAASKLNHPHVCTIHEVGEADPLSPFVLSLSKDERGSGQASSPQAVIYIAMELVEGQPLSARLAEGPLRPDELLRYGLQLTDAVAHAHERGVVHRDLKSSNVVVTPDGRVKVLEFGLSRPLGREELTEATTVTPVSPPPSSRLPVETLAYLAPEQLRGQPGDARSDVWALGVLLQEMATGRRPFQGQTAFALSSAILNEAAPSLPASVPVELQAVIERCLRKEPGQRYRRASDVHAALEAVQSGTALPRREAVRRAWMPRRWLAVVAIAVVLVAVAGGFLVGRLSRRPPGTPAAPALHAVAVLPLANLSGDPNQQYFVDGLTDALINDLARIGGALRVISRTSTEMYARAPKPIPQIARELGVEAIVEGSVAREGDLVRVTASLIEAATERRLWSDRYERNLTSILALQADIARAVAQAIKGALSPAEQQKLARMTREVNPKVWEAYTKGMHFLNQSTPGALQKGMEYLHQAVELDPTDPLAYAGLAGGYITLAHGAEPPPDALRRAKAAAQTAVELDPTLPQGVFALGVIKGYDEWDWSGGITDLRCTIDLNPSFAMAHYHLAWFLALVGRMPEAIDEHIRARDADPLNPLHTAWLGSLYSQDGQYDKAFEEAGKAIELNPKFPIGYRVLGEVYRRQGKWDQAIEAIQKAAGMDPAWRWLLGVFYVEAGKTAEARLIMAELEKHAVTPWTALWRARLYAALDNKEAAFKWLNYERPHIWTPWFLRKGTTEAIYTKLHDDPRFRELQRKMNVPKWGE